MERSHWESRAEDDSRRKRWQETERLVDEIVDGRGLRIDEEIKPLVIALKVNEFGTTQSCAGHLDGGVPFPWVDVESEYAERVYSSSRYRELTKKMRAARKDPAAISAKERQEYEQLVFPIPEFNAAANGRLQSVLREYGQQRTGSEPQLEIDVWSVVRRSRLRPTSPGGGEVRADGRAGWTVEERTQRLDADRRAMNEFAAFLKEKFVKG